MENTTIPSADLGGCSIHSVCVAYYSLAVTLGLMTCCFGCAVCIRLLGEKYPKQVSPFIAHDPVTVIVDNKPTIAFTTASTPVQPEEDPS
jgi:hypothetical protein